VAKRFLLPEEKEPLPKIRKIFDSDIFGYFVKDCTKAPLILPQLENSFKLRGLRSSFELRILLANSPKLEDINDFDRFIFTFKILVINIK